MEAGSADAGGDHRLCRQELHLHHEDAAGDGADQEGCRSRQGQAKPHTDKVGRLTRTQAEEIAQDQNAGSDGGRSWMPPCARSPGSARSMGIEVEGL